MNEKKSFFVVCEDCKKKIFIHKGYLESPPGFFTFDVECDCGLKFAHRMMTEKVRIKKALEQRKIVATLFNPEKLAQVVKRTQRAMEREDDD